MSADLTKRMTGFQRLILTKVPTGTLMRWVADARAMVQRLNNTHTAEEAKLEDAVYEPFRNDNFSFSITDIKQELSTRNDIQSIDLDEQRKPEKDARQLPLRMNQFRHKR